MEPQFERWLNMIHGSPSFALKEDPRDAGTWIVIDPPVIPDDSGYYIVSGVTTFPDGRCVDSAFMTSSVGELHEVYWRTESGWVDSADPAAGEPFGRDRSSLFPFDWEFAIPLELDIYHDDIPPRRPKLP